MAKGTIIKNHAIDIHSLKMNDVDAWADFAWYYWPEMFSELFRRIGILVENEADVKALVDLHRKNGDVSGEIKTPSGTRIRFNFLEVLKSIPVDKQRMFAKFGANNDFQLIKK